MPSEKTVNVDRHRSTQIDAGRSILFTYKMIDVYRRISTYVDIGICVNFSTHLDSPTRSAALRVLREPVCPLLCDLAIPDLWLVVYATSVSLRVPRLHIPSHYPPVVLRYYLDKRRLYMPRTTNIFRCDCEQCCKGQERVVSRGTYFAHKKYRDRRPLLRFSQQHQDLLANCSVVENLSSSSASRHTAHLLTQITDGTSGPSSQHACRLGSADPNDHGHAAVGASDYAHI
jgi:hypothetical protein